MEVLDENLEHALKKIAYARACADWLTAQGASEDCKEVIKQMTNAMAVADAELSRYITYGISEAKDHEAAKAHEEISAIVNKHKERA